MTRTKEKVKDQAAPEPMGIVISGGPTRETPPIISAYVWGPAPEEEPDTPAPRVA